jgi:uncharacterized protein
MRPGFVKRSARLTTRTLSIGVLIAFMVQPGNGQSQNGSSAPTSLSLAEISTKASQALQAKDYASAMAYYRMAADKGDAQAQYDIGLLYSNGMGVSRDDKIAFQWFHVAAAQGHVASITWLGVMYASGRGVQQDYIESMKWNKKAAELGSPHAQHNLGLMYYFGQAVPVNTSEAMRWFRQSAEQGFAKAQLSLGLMYKGKGPQQNYAEAMKWFQSSADQGLAAAQFELGSMYVLAIGIPLNIAEGAKWILKSAEQGDARAEFYLGLMYSTGVGVSQDDDKAVDWFEKAAEQGNAPAQDNLGKIYEEGTVVRQNYATAAQWYQKSASQGEPIAQNHLGNAYYKGRGVSQDYVEAVKWYRLAADQGNADAQTNLGAMYLQGSAVDQNYAESFKWFQLAAGQGNEAAQYNLGLMYAGGTGVKQNDILAHMWLNVSASRGNSNAPKARDAIARRLTASQVLDAQRMAREWKPTSPDKAGITAALMARTPTTLDNSSTPACNDQRVLNDFLNQYVCRGLLTCDNLGIDYKSLRNMNEIEIRSLVMRSVSIASQSLGEFNPAQRVIWNTYTDSAISSVEAAKHVVKDVKMTTAYFDSEKHEYTCRAEISTDKPAMSKIFRNYGYASLFYGKHEEQMKSALMEGKDVQEVLRLVTLIASQTEQRFLQCSRFDHHFKIQPARSDSGPSAFVLVYDVGNETFDRECMRHIND